MAPPIFVATFIFMWVMYIWETYLSYRQYNVYKDTKEIPVELKDTLDKDTFEKARLYQVDKSRFSFFASIYSQIESSLILLLNGLPYLWDVAGAFNSSLGYDETHEIKQSITFMLLATVFSTFTGLPWSLYSTFVVEERHGFNKQSIGFFFKDLIKKTIVSMCIALPVTSSLLWIIKWGGEYFFLYAWLFTFGVSLFIIAIYHDYIAPLFDRFIPLPQGELRTNIENLANRIQFPLSKIFVVEGSKRSSHSNAYFFGFYKKKVIVLFDTLLKVSPFEEEKLKKENEVTDSEKKTLVEEVQENVLDNEDEVDNLKKDEKSAGKAKGCSDEEILAILGHELGHWKLNHTLKNLCISQVNLLCSFFAFGLLMQKDVLFESFGFFGEKPTLIGLLIIFQFIFSPYNELFGFLMTVLSRKFEFEADEFGKSLGYGSQLQTALIQLHKENLGFPVADKLYSSYHYSHPPLLERLRALKVKQE